MHTTDPLLSFAATYALHDEAEYLAEAGEWVLFRSRFPVVPLLSPDVPLERPPPPSMREKIALVVPKLAEHRHDFARVVIPPEPGPSEEKRPHL
jgi:hypothetical protein